MADLLPTGAVEGLHADVGQADGTVWRSQPTRSAMRVLYGGDVMVNAELVAQAMLR